MKSEKQSDGSWRLIDVPDPQCDWIGPYTSEREAEKSRVRIQRTFDALDKGGRAAEKHFNG